MGTFWERNRRYTLEASILIVAVALLLTGTVGAIAHTRANSVPSGTQDKVFEGTTAPPVSREHVSAYLIGDSLTAGTGASSQSRQFGPLAAARLGWDLTIDGIGGSGFLNKGVAPEGKAEGEVDRSLPTRVDELAAAAPKIVIVAAGRNDIYSDPELVRSAMSTFFDEVRVALPEAKIVTVGTWRWDTTSEAQLSDAVAQLDSMLQEMTARVGGTFIPSRTFLAVDDSNAATLLYDDGFHPNDAGYALIAESLAESLYEAGLPLGPEIWRETALHSNKFEDVLAGGFESTELIEGPTPG